MKNNRLRQFICLTSGYFFGKIYKNYLIEKISSI
ncbi:hypothetical protein MHA_0382 [Mannheimia haemolytica PHL213]|nr:hypothetical protein MHA_0382 [Mannheimia haemolytica PHL213]